MSLSRFLVRLEVGGRRGDAGICIYIYIYHHRRDIFGRLNMGITKTLTLRSLGGH